MDISWKISSRERATHSLGCLGWDHMSSSVKKTVRPSAFLVDDAREVPRIIVPRGRRLLAEALDASEGSILNGDFPNKLG